MHSLHIYIFLMCFFLSVLFLLLIQCSFFLAPDLDLKENVGIEQFLEERIRAVLIGNKIAQCLNNTQREKVPFIGFLY